MSALAFNLLRIAYLVLLWLFVLFAIGVLRRDLLTRVRDNVGDGSRRGRRRNRDLASAAMVAPVVATPIVNAPIAEPPVIGDAPVPVASYSVGGVPLPPGAPPPAGTEAKKPRRRAKAAAAAPTPTELVVTAGSLAGTRIPLDGTSVLIGRAPSSTLVISDDFASSRHARIFQESGDWFLEDLGSTNGTFVGGQRVTSILPLAVGSTVQIGQSMMELR